mmetsp:Transcript_4102/g.8012  ORF Transcript_4102/g.8012 Transcript_4102/m.8012 type:complete len:309 (-) Transcript_4102:1198-2124(-)
MGEGTNAAPSFTSLSLTSSSPLSCTECVDGKGAEVQKSSPILLCDVSLCDGRILEGMGDFAGVRVGTLKNLLNTVPPSSTSSSLASTSSSFDWNNATAVLSPSLLPPFTFLCCASIDEVLDRWPLSSSPSVFADFIGVINAAEASSLAFLLFLYSLKNDEKLSLVVFLFSLVPTSCFLPSSPPPILSALFTCVFLPPKNESRGPLLTAANSTALMRFFFFATPPSPPSLFPKSLSKENKKEVEDVVSPSHFFLSSISLKGSRVLGLTCPSERSLATSSSRSAPRKSKGPADLLSLFPLSLSRSPSPPP